LAFTKQEVLCYGFSTGNISLNISGGTAPYSYNWSSGQSSNTIDKISAGEYTVSVTDINNCAVSQAIEVSQPALIEGKPEIIQPYCDDDDQGEIQLQIEGGIAPYQVLWNTGVRTVSLDHIRPGIYIYRITDMNNCVIRDTIDLLPKHPACLDIPNAISPNGDGINDTWIILAGDPKNPVEVATMYPRAIVEVYTRWGTLVYRSEPGYPTPWDGTLHGRSLPLDSYYYVFDTKCGKHPIKGIITIVK
jgi:gliding motility-associated-like protein